MGKKQKLRILHLSDLHERAKFEGMPPERLPRLECDARDRGLLLGPRFEESLSEFLDEGIDFVFFTGDVADYGRPEEYEKADARFSKILRIVNVPKDRFFAVPGNHDVQRLIQKSEWEKIRDYIARTNDLSQLGRWCLNAAEAPVGLENGILEKVKERTEAFWQWLASFQGVDLRDPKYFTGFLKEFAPGSINGIDKAINIIGFDSAWLCGNNSDQGNISIFDDLAFAKLRKGEKALEGFNLGLIHHPLSYLKNQTQIRRILADNQIDYLFRGHQHEPLALEIKEAGRRLNILASGCLIEGEYGKNWPNGFQLLEIDFKDLSSKLHFRKWSKDSYFWAKGSDLYREAPDGVLAINSPVASENVVEASIDKFSKDDFMFTDDWVRTHIENSVSDLGVRYSNKVNVDLDLDGVFGILARNGAFRKEGCELLAAYLKEYDCLIHSLSNTEISINNSEFDFFSTFIDPLIEISENLQVQFENLQSKELKTLNIDLLRTSCKELIELLDNFDASTDIAESVLRNFRELAWRLKSKVDNPLFTLVNHPVLLVSGEAGIGKSHLLADLVRKKLCVQKPSIFLLGQYFTNTENPWKQILNNLRLEIDSETLLSKLNEKAKNEGERLFFVIDAINEGKGRYFWPEFIGGFINSFSKHPWIGLIISVRESYEKLLLPETQFPRDLFPRFIHHGFRGLELVARKEFFKNYGIEEPRYPLFHPEFSNPLFLKLFCEGLKKSNLTKIPPGHTGITRIFNFFLDSIENRLSAPAYLDYPSSLKIVKKAIENIIEQMLSVGDSCINYEEAYLAMISLQKKFSISGDLLESLISEGILIKDNVWLDEDNSEEVVMIAYERLGDHLMCAHLIEKYLQNIDESNPFAKGGELEKYISSNCDQGLIEAFSIQVPEKSNYELFELVEDDKKASCGVVFAFIASIAWRKKETFKDAAESFIENTILESDSFLSNFFQMNFLVAADPDQMFNSEFLHQYLRKFNLADRDAKWTIYLNNCSENEHSIHDLINWSFLADKETLCDESRLLASKALAWIFPTTSLILRDNATRALANLLKENCCIIPQLFDEFLDVDDPYVIERIFAAAYGAITNSKKLHGLEETCKYLIKEFFSMEEVYPNILVRDYARNIIEYAISKGIFELDPNASVRPPYSSEFPEKFPSNEEMDALKFDYESETFCDHYWSQNAILNSMITEYGRGLSSYGDFGRYTFQSKVRRWEQFDPNDLSNYAVKLIFEKFGYDVEKHGSFDRHEARKDNRFRNRVERIGKKYQWLALYEVLARLTDNHRLIDQSKKNRGEDPEVWNQGSWEPFIRNLDPTNIIPSHQSDEIPSISFSVPEMPSSDLSNEDWIVSKIDLPDPKKLILLSNSWISLDGSKTWKEKPKVDFEINDGQTKCLWFEISSYFMKKNDFEKLLKAEASGADLSSINFPDISSNYQVFWQEYYWSPAYKFFDDPYYGERSWQRIYLDGKNHSEEVDLLSSSQIYNWESGADEEAKKSIFIPCETLFEYSDLSYSSGLGIWEDTSSNVACFSPSQFGFNASSLSVKSDLLKKFLENTGLEIFWVCHGRKEIRIKNHSDFDLKNWLEVFGIFTFSEGKIQGNLNSTVRSIMNR